MKLADILQLVGAAALGFIVSIIYIHYAWYSSDQSSKNVGETRRIKALLWILGPGGALMAISKWFPSSSTFNFVFASSTLAFIAAWLLLLFLSGALSGYQRSTSEHARLSAAFNEGWACVFEGWKRGYDRQQKGELEMHLKSKHSLCDLALETHQLLKYIKSESIHGKGSFNKFFKSISSNILYSYFQHHANSHPDFCACYFRWDPLSRELRIVCSISGSDKNSINDNTILKSDSVAWHALQKNRTLVYPECKAELKLKKLNPLLRKSVKKFIVMPIYKNDTETGEESYRGCLSIDSSKDTFHFNDPFHQNILKILAFITGELDELLLGQEL